MKKIVNLFSIYFVGVIFPALLMLFNGYWAGKNPESWSQSNLNNVSTILLTLSIVACFAIVVINYNQKKVSFWYTLSITFAIALGLLLYVGLSVSNFGF